MLRPNSHAGTSFVEGNGTFKVDTIKKHESSTTHQEALRIKAAKNRPAEESHIGQGLYRGRRMANSKYLHLFRTCHAMALKGRPFTDYTWLCKLDRQKGVDIGNMYQSDKFAQKYTHYIAEVERMKMVIVN